MFFSSWLQGHQYYHLDLDWLTERGKGCKIHIQVKGNVIRNRVSRRVKWLREIMRVTMEKSKNGKKHWLRVTMEKTKTGRRWRSLVTLQGSALLRKVKAVKSFLGRRGKMSKETEEGVDESWLSNMVAPGRTWTFQFELMETNKNPQLGTGVTRATFQPHSRGRCHHVE